MKRLRRWVCNGLAALSLALCVATICLWIIGCFSDVSLNWESNSISYSLSCSRGEMSSSRIVWGLPVPTANAGWNLLFLRPASLLDRNQILAGIIGHYRLRFLGFALFWIHKPAVMEGPEFLWPCWALVLLTAVLPAMWIRQRQRLKPGHCTVCGYDLRATPDRCPECGTIPQNPA